MNVEVTGQANGESHTESFDYWHRTLGAVIAKWSSRLRRAHIDSRATCLRDVTEGTVLFLEPGEPSICDIRDQPIRTMRVLGGLWL